MALRNLLETIEETVRMVELREEAEAREKGEKEEVREAARQASNEEIYSLIAKSTLHTHCTLANRISPSLRSSLAPQNERLEMERREREMEEGRGMSNADVLRKASMVDTAGIEVDRTQEGGGGGKSFMESEITPEIKKSYAPLLEKILPPYGPGETVAMAVKKNYEMCDAQLIKVLVEKKENGEEGAAECVEAITKLQEKKMAGATEKLKKVLAAGSPALMEGEILKLSKDNGIDEAFLLLLEANMNMAKEAGAAGPAEVMARLKKKAEMEKDKTASAPELRLLRQLIREPDAAERER